MPQLSHVFVSYIFMTKDEKSEIQEVKSSVTYILWSSANLESMCETTIFPSTHRHPTEESRNFFIVFLALGFFSLLDILTVTPTDMRPVN